MSRSYCFTLEDQSEGTIVGELEIAVEAESPDLEDFRVIIASCCTLILQCAEYVHPDIIERVKRIQLETGLGPRMNS